MKKTVGVCMLLMVSAAGAHEAGDILVRGGLATVAPDASSSPLVLDGGSIDGSEADVDNNTQIGLTAVYMMTDTFGLEVLASTPFSHDISAETGVLGLGEVAAGDTKHLPPTVSVLWFPAAPDSQWQPYLGAGFNYTLFFDEDVAGELEGVLGSGELELDGSFGLALQGGVDYKFNDKWFANAAVRWIDIDTDAEFTFGESRLTTEVEIDPLVYSLSIGYKF
ncbi:MAG: OmpW family outer membrane protein [Pseudomonadota bacterium]